ncbi:hypothetical protein FSP39_016264 [Pinctada imbricata]|uniref:Uncharacterized protein n=1 Tax=Pinctada imbricata TaxID=66713 RepID=A0AA88YPL7_PINIB|nr:hypothetical protein FSP39_016264 [Pinctada imbricata]
MATRDKIEKRGHAYRCLGCNKYEGEKRYVEAHYYKYHAALDSVPFYCSLCHFMGKTLRELEKHVKGYKPHKTAVENMVKEGRQPAETAQYIHKNDNPLQLGEGHLLMLSLEESRKVWTARQKVQSTSDPTASDPLKEVPEPLKEKEPTVEMPTLPEIDLPEQEPMEYDLLEEILGGSDKEAKRFQDDSREEEKLDVAKRTLETMQAILEATRQNGQLLTCLNTGIRKNTMVLEDLVRQGRNNERDSLRRWADERRRWAEERARWRTERSRLEREVQPAKRRGTLKSVVRRKED